MAKEVIRDVCSACGGIWNGSSATQCPSCRGKLLKDQDCLEDDAGVVKPVPVE